MNLYLITRPEQWDYDQYDSAVVCALSEADARMIHPGGRDDWNGIRERYDSWVNADSVIVTLIGVADPACGQGSIICASFNAG